MPLLFSLAFVFGAWLISLYLFFFIGLRPKVTTAWSITFDKERAKEYSQKDKEAFRDLQEEGGRAQTSRPMDPILIRSLSADMEAQLATSRLRKSRSAGKVRPFTSVTMAVPVGKD